MGKVVGIDLGTTNSVVAVMEGKEVKVIPNAHGSPLTPSVVGFSDRGERLVGILGKRQAVTNAENTVYSIKRFMGRRREEVTGEEKMVPYKITGSAGDAVRVAIRDKVYTPQEISAMVLMDLKLTAEAYLGDKVTDAVITCPAYFNNSQREATKEAGVIAGFNVRRIFNEPTAAALAYGLDKRKNQKIAVYDLGGGTFDISILEVDNEVIQVLSTNGNTHLGGDDFDQRLLQHVADEFRKQNGVDLRKDSMAMQRLKEACERAKCELSTLQETEINLPYITMAEGQVPKHLTMKLTRSLLERLVGDLIESSLGPVEAALRDAKLKPEQIEEVVLVGGSTRIPMVQKLVRDHFKREPNRSVNPDEVVAVGAAIQGAVLGGEMKEILLLDVTPLTLGLETLGGVRTPLIKRNSSIPTRKSEVFSTAADNQPQVDIKILQGEREMAADNRTLGVFTLDGIEPAPRSVPKIEVTFDLDENGILSVAAKDLKTQREQKITVKASTGLSEAEIKRMVDDAEKSQADDVKRREAVEARNLAEQRAYEIEKFLKEKKDLPEADQKVLQGALQKLGRAQGEPDAAAIKKAVEEVRNEVAGILYKHAQAAEAPPPKDEPKKKGGDDKVIDADFEVK